MDTIEPALSKPPTRTDLLLFGDEKEQRWAPDWVLDVGERDAQTAWAALGIFRFREQRYLWPTRREAFTRCCTRVSSAKWMERLLVEILPGYGVRVFRFSRRNPRGPITVRYGFDPELTVIGNARPGSKLYGYIVEEIEVSDPTTAKEMSA